MAKKDKPDLVRGTYKGEPTWFINDPLRRRRRHASADRVEAEAKLQAYIAKEGRKGHLATTPIETICDWAKTGVPYEIPRNGILANFGGLTVGDISQASVDAKLKASGGRVAGNAKMLVRTIKRYADAQTLPGAPEVRFAFVPPRREMRNLQRPEVARLLWACRGYQWDKRSKTMRRIPDDQLRHEVRLLRRPIARSILLAVYAGIHPELSRNLLWERDPDGGKSFVLLPDTQSNLPAPWPIPAKERRLLRLGDDAPTLDKLKKVPVTLSSRITAHLMRWRRKDLPRFKRVVHGRQAGKYGHSTANPRFAEVCEDAGLHGVTPDKLLATYAAFALREGAIMRNVAIAMGIAFETADRLYRVLAKNFMKGIEDASKRRAVSTR